MKIKCILSAAMAGVLLMTGCSGDNTESVATYDLDAAGNVIPITDSYIPSAYKPASGSWTVMKEEIHGAPGEVTDTRIPAVFLTTDDPDSITKEEYAPCTVQIDAGMTDGQYESTGVLNAEEALQDQAGGKDLPARNDRSQALGAPGELRR